MAESKIPDVTAPANIRAIRRIGEWCFIPGEGDVDASDIMFVSPAALEEELSEEQRVGYGKTLKVKPQLLKGPAGSIFKDLASRCGIKDFFYTALCRWLLPKENRLRPKRPQVEYGAAALEDDIARVRPKIVVALGKAPFEYFIRDVKGSISDLAGAWFYDPVHDVPVYPMEDITKLVTKPEFMERFRQDMVEIRRMRDELNGVVTAKMPTNYITIRDKHELAKLVYMLRDGNYKVLSVDCEWQGINHVDGQLRSLQICWAPGQAAYIRFMDDLLTPVEETFGCSYEEAGLILSEWLDNPEVKYIGHHLSADLPWMFYKLGLQWYGKGMFDTEYAQQCVDEYEPLGLERLAIKYTDLGRYDMELYLWCKANKKLVAEGYGLIPDHILIPYACADVDVVMRAWPILREKMDKQAGLSVYYDEIFLPFVTNFFTSYALRGLPMNIDRMKELRELYNWAAVEMLHDFRVKMTAEAEMLFMRILGGMMGSQGIVLASDVLDMWKSDRVEEAEMRLKTEVGPARYSEILDAWVHLIHAADFNINSSEDIKRWLFSVKGYTPIKSTNQKEKGLPSISWEKVMSMDEKVRKEYKPSADGQTLEILKSTHSDPLLSDLLSLKAVNTVCKNFLKQPLTDDEGNILEERGLVAWIASDGRVHGQMSTTETGRPRAWQPNILNWASWVNSKIASGIKEVVKSRFEVGSLPAEFEKYLTEKVPSIRSCVDASVLGDWCMVESDYQTAELRSQAWLSACVDMMNLISLPDLNFVHVKDPVDEDCVVRVGYPAYIREEFRSDEWLGAYGASGNVIKRYTEDDYLRDESGAVVHTKQDLHWSLAEMVHGKPREVLHKKKDRGAAKTANFGAAYGASAATLERKIESDTGIQPDPGTGDALLAALERRQPRATAFLKSMEDIPLNPGFYQALSGRIRHFHTHPDNISGLSERTRSGQVSAMGRECRNFPMQESVAATAARAGNWLIKFGKDFELSGFILTILYDAIVTVCPMYERAIWAKAHKLFMYLKNGWQAPTSILRYPIDTELNMAWSWKPTEAEKSLLKNETYAPTPPNLKAAEEWLDRMIQQYTEHEELSVISN